MIRLNQIDYRRLLDGARVPLVRVAPDPLPEWAQPMTEQMRGWLFSGCYEWRVDGAWRFEGDEGRRQDLDWDWTALDPSDPDVARWCDRRIAFVVVARSWGGTAPIIDAVLGLARSMWKITTLHSDGRCEVWGFYREESVALRAIPCDDAHIPTARAALVLALFGRTL